MYVLRSLKHVKFYIGVTKDLEARLKQHNKGYSKSTKPYKPWKIAYYEEYESKETAYKREWHLKHPKGYNDKLEIIRKID